MASNTGNVADFTEQLRKWFQRRNMSSDKDYSETIWTDIKALFEVLATSIKTRDTVTTSVCEAAFPTWIWSKNAAEFTVCRRIVNIFLFMDSRHKSGGQWTTQRIFTEEAQFEDYVRCMLGNIAMAELFKTNCSARDIIDKVSTHMDTFRHSFGHADGSKLCKDMGYETLMVGSKFVAATMARWIQTWRLKFGGGKVAGKGPTTCNKDKTDPQARSNVPAVRMFQKEDNLVITELVKAGKDLDMEKKKQLVEELEDKRQQDGVLADIMRQITEAEAKLGVRSGVGQASTSTVQTTPPSPPGRSDPGSGQSSGYAPAPPAATEPATSSSPQAPSGKDR
ncbi:hypothetical protein AK88_05399 [Plasmodium fragile]|uniref:Schizont-infected cell agglutination extracellular alpha domain-containing protein n=1 Tax=Plasmodium fragile TaxID=5857 RepID=A0A0D9QD23_PLAFR|nr:uncharacterized protein AK88_05399 [Plasmodium fragile]KJP84960.1 hypothetical protein AK88_05399 [Plasmodium fragile]